LVDSCSMKIDGIAEQNPLGRPFAFIRQRESLHDPRAGVLASASHCPAERLRARLRLRLRAVGSFPSGNNFGHLGDTFIQIQIFYNHGRLGIPGRGREV